MIDDDAFSLVMDARMNMPMRVLSRRLAALHIEERLIRKETIDSDEYYYLDYDWFFEVVQFRLRHMEEVLKEREERRRGGHLYQCPRCEIVITAGELSKNMARGGYCVRCAESGQLSEEELAKECRMREVPRDTVDIQDQRQQMRQQLHLDDFSRFDEPRSARELLTYFQRHEDAGQPIFPIPLHNILDALKEFKDKGIPQSGFSTNRPTVQRAVSISDEGDGKAAFAMQMDMQAAKSTAAAASARASHARATEEHGSDVAGGDASQSRKRPAAVLAEPQDASASSASTGDDAEQKERRAYVLKRRKEAMRKEADDAKNEAAQFAAGGTGVDEDDDEDDFEDG